jgi:hypothetical protein
MTRLVHDDGDDSKWTTEAASISLIWLTRCIFTHSFDSFGRCIYSCSVRHFFSALDFISQTSKVQSIPSCVNEGKCTFRRYMMQMDTLLLQIHPRILGNPPLPTILSLPLQLHLQL